MNTFIRCLKAAEFFRRQPSLNLDPDFDLMDEDLLNTDFHEDFQGGKVASWVIESEILEAVDFDLEIVSSCPGSFTYYDFVTKVEWNARSAYSLSDVSETRRKRCARRWEKRCCCVERGESDDGYEADTECQWRCRHNKLLAGEGVDFMAADELDSVSTRRSAGGRVTSGNALSAMPRPLRARPNKSAAVKTAHSSFRLSSSNGA